MLAPRMRMMAAAAVCAVFLAACTRPPQKPPAPAGPPPEPAPETAGQAGPADQAPRTQPDSLLSFLPSRSRALYAGETGAADTAWTPLGVEFTQLLARAGGKGMILGEATLYSGEAALTEAGTLSAQTRVTVLGATPWEAVGGRFRRLYHVKAPAAPRDVSGWVDSSACALILSETQGLSIGVMERKIVVSEGESEYSILVLARPGGVTLADTSAFLFPDSFHPGGIVGAEITDVNGDGVAEIVVEADFIVSFSYLGASPLRAEIWLARADGGFRVIFKYNKSFATDEGYRYSATRTLLDTDGDGLRETVKTVTEYTQETGADPFKNTLISFSVYNGTQYVKDPGQDLPKMGSVSAGGALLSAEPGGPEPSAPDASDMISAGDTVFVLDRADSSQASDGEKGFWYRVLTHGEREGWVKGAHLTLEWVDPYKMNRARFLAPEAPADGRP
jgi:hypothetical protein